MPSFRRPPSVFLRGVTVPALKSAADGPRDRDGTGAHDGNRNRGTPNQDFLSGKDCCIP